MIDFEIQRCTRHCAVSGRELRPGEVFYSVLLAEGASWKRLDYSAECWHGAPEGCIAWWRTQMPRPEQKRRWAPGEVMLRCWEQLAEHPERADLRYLLTLLMIRRRILRLEQNLRTEDGREVLVVYCPEKDSSYEVAAVLPSEDRIQELERELMQLLEGDEGEIVNGTHGDSIGRASGQAHHG